MVYQGGIVDTASAVDWIGRVADLDNGHVYAVADADDHPIGWSSASATAYTCPLSRSATRPIQSTADARSTIPP